MTDKQEILRKDVLMAINRYQANFGDEATSELIFETVVVTHPGFSESVENERFKIVENMQTFGGSFVKALAECVRRADVINYIRLRNALPDLFKKYHPDNWGKRKK